MTMDILQVTPQDELDMVGLSRVVLNRVWNFKKALRPSRLH